MFAPSGSTPIAVTSAPSCSNARGAISLYAPFAQSTPIFRPVEIRAEPLDDVLEVAVGRNADAVDLAAARRSGVEQRLDLLLGRVGQLLAVAVEELDAVVLGRIVRGGDHRADVEREQRDRGRRQHASEHGGAAGRRDAAPERLLELDAGRTRVAPDEHAASSRPERDRLAQLLDELRRQALADDSADTVGAEVTTRHAARR